MVEGIHNWIMLGLVMWLTNQKLFVNCCSSEVYFHLNNLLFFRFGRIYLGPNFRSLLCWWAQTCPTVCKMEKQVRDWGEEGVKCKM